MQDRLMYVLTAAESAKTTALASLSSKSGVIDIDAQVRAFSKAYIELPPFAAYRFVTAPARGIHERFEKENSADISKDFLYVCILQAIIDSAQSATIRSLPGRVQAHQLKQFERIIKNADSVRANCAIDTDLFLKDMGLASLRLYAAAAQLIDYRTGIGRA